MMNLGRCPQIRHSSFEKFVVKSALLEKQNFNNFAFSKEHFCFISFVVSVLDFDLREYLDLLLKSI